VPYLLDGNNLIGRARAGDGDRDALVREIADRLRATRARATVFFDGPAAQTATLGSLSVRSCGGSADEAIAREVERAASPSQLIVVTADRELARRVRDAGAKALAPADFWSRFGRGGPARPRDDAGAVDVEDWMRYFADEANRD